MTVHQNFSVKIVHLREGRLFTNYRMTDDRELGRALATDQDYIAALKAAYARAGVELVSATVVESLEVETITA